MAVNGLVFGSGRGLRALGARSLLACVLASAGCSGRDGSGDPQGGDAGDRGAENGSAGSDPFDNNAHGGSGQGGAAGGGASGRGGSSGDDGGGGQGGNGGGSGGNGGSSGPTGYVPQFPGAGTAADTEPLQGGELCDSVAGDAPPIPPTVTRCFFGADGTNPAATIEQALECVDDHNTVHLRLTFDPDFNDNTFGTGSIGWSPVRGHWFSDLVGSDHAELKLVDGNGEVAMQFKLDYIESDASAPSGYATLGVHGGDGSVTIGDADHVIAYSTSLDKNLNERGYGEYTVDSPATDASYTPNPETPEWDYRMVFEVWIDLEAFGDAGFSGAFIDYVHASPSKDDNETIDVTPDECPPPPCELADGCGGDNPCYDDDPDTFCDRGDPCYDHDPGTMCDAGDPCLDGDPDTVCDTGSPPPPPPPDDENPPAYCDLYPTDPECNVD